MTALSISRIHGLGEVQQCWGLGKVSLEDTPWVVCHQRQRTAPPGDGA